MPREVASALVENNPVNRNDPYGEDSEALAATYSVIFPVGGFSGTVGVYSGEQGPPASGEPIVNPERSAGVYANLEVGFGMLVGGGIQYEVARGPETNSLEGGTVNYPGCLGVCLTLTWSEDASFPSWPTGTAVGGPGLGGAVTLGEAVTAETRLESASSFGSGPASGGFVLYPSKPNLNMASRVYAK